MLRLASAISLIFLAACAPMGVEQAAPANGPAWPAAVRDFASPEQLLQVAGQFQNSSGMQRRRLSAAMQAKDAAAVLDTAQRLAAMGAVLSPAAQGQIAQVVGAEAMAPIAAQFAANAQPLAASRVYATIPAGHQLVEGLVWDSSARRLYATTVVDRSLLAVGATGTIVAASEGLGSLFGGAYDPVRKRIWVASASVEQTPKDRPAFIGLVSFDPRNPGAVQRVAAPEGVTATPGDVAVARDGTVYASDGLNGALYRCLPGCSTLEVYLAPDTLFSSQGLAFSADQRLLYITDRRYGIAALERATGKLFHVTGGNGVMLDGIDGLVSYQGSLIGTQTAYPPTRIVRLDMSPDGLRVERLEVLERANPEWEEVTLATVAGDELVYVAGAQWERYGDGGAPAAGKPAQATVLRSLRLR